VTRSPYKSAYASGEHVTLTAVPATGHQFKSWSGDLSGSANPATIVMDSDKSVSASFEPEAAEQHNLGTSVSPTGAGSVSRSPERPSYSHGEEVTLTAVPIFGFAFAGWAVSGSANPVTITMDSDKSITASFQMLSPQQHDLAMWISPSGSGSVARFPSAPTYPHGQEVTLTAMPGSGYVFANWAGDLSGEVNPAKIVMDSDKSVTACFQPGERKCTLTISPAEGGSVVDPGHGSFVYDPGESVRIEAEATPGYYFLLWRGSAVDSGYVANPLAASTMVTMDADCTLEPYFGHVEINPVGQSASSSPGRSAMVLYNPASESPALSLKASATPGAQSFHWDIVSGSDKVVFIDDPNAQVVTLTPLGSSEQKDDVIVRVTCLASVGSAAMQTDHLVTVLEPTSLREMGSSHVHHDDSVMLYSFTFLSRVLDQFDSPLQARMPITKERRLVYTNYWKASHESSGPDPETAADGSFDYTVELLRRIQVRYDCLRYYYVGTPADYVRQVVQSIEAAGWYVGQRCLTYYCHEATLTPETCEPLDPRVKMADTSGTISPGDAVTHDVPIDSSVSVATFLTEWPGSDLDLVLLSPNGDVVDPAEVDQVLTIDYVEGPTREYYTVRGPTPGTWKMLVTAVDVPLEGEAYNALVVGDSTVVFSLVDGADYQPQDAVPIMASLRYSGIPQSSATVHAEVENPLGVVISLRLSVGGDGQYSGLYTNTSIPGVYRITATATGTVGGNPFQRIASTVVYVGDRPDLVVGGADIHFSNEAPLPDELITVSAFIANAGKGHAPDIEVSFYDGEPSTETFIGRQLVTLNPGGSTTVEAPWAIPGGRHEVFVAIQPSTEVFEDDYENNIASRVICAVTADVNADERVDLRDLLVVSDHWLHEQCDCCAWCDGADLDFSGTVDLWDYSLFAREWEGVKTPQPSSSGLVAHWALDEGGGTVAVDCVGDQDGVVEGAAWCAGIIDGALRFDGVDDYVDCGSAGVPAPERMTVAFWMQTLSLGQDRYILGKAGGCAGAGEDDGGVLDADALAGSGPVHSRQGGAVGLRRGL